MARNWMMKPGRTRTPYHNDDAERQFEERRDRQSAPPQGGDDLLDELREMKRRKDRRDRKIDKRNRGRA